jgi:nitroimidazol reductase NimA-like FMN-containing flavoprotein (pyridoxamine 5'-phosphate oxidase superfamily)
MRKPLILSGDATETSWSSLANDGYWLTRAHHQGVAAVSETGNLGIRAGMEAIVEELGESEALRLIEQAEVGRIGFTGRYGPVVLPVSYKVIGQDIVFRAGMYAALGEDLRTGIPGAEYRVAFEVDELRPPTQSGWMVMIQGTAHHVDDEADRAELIAAGVEQWEATENALFMRITPVFVAGRRISRGLRKTAAVIARREEYRLP